MRILFILFLLCSTANAASLTVNQIPKATVGGSTPTIGDSVITDNGNVGVSSTNPGQKLDVSGTVRAINFIGSSAGLTGLPSGYTTTVTAAGTTTFTVSSTYQQYFTGSSSQVVHLPVTSTLSLGQQFSVTNKSTGGDITVQSSAGGGGNTVATITANQTIIFTCILTSGTTAASWTATPIGIGGTITSGQIPFGNSTTVNTLQGSANATLDGSGNLVVGTAATNSLTSTSASFGSASFSQTLTIDSVGLLNNLDTSNVFDLSGNNYGPDDGIPTITGLKIYGSATFLNLDGSASFAGGTVAISNAGAVSITPASSSTNDILCFQSGGTIGHMAQTELLTGGGSATCQSF